MIPACSTGALIVCHSAKPTELPSERRFFYFINIIAALFVSSSSMGRISAAERGMKEEVGK
jgi:hypothetical protein